MAGLPATRLVTSGTGSVAVRDLCVSRGGRRVLQGLNCHFPLTGISVILGGSGSGKSTLLRALSRLIRPDSGQIWVGEEFELCRMSEREAHAFRRNVGMMFQGGALLDSLSVFDNVALPLREHTRRNRDEIADEVRKVFESVGLEGVDHLLPSQLSGGMMKRAALARALILAAPILLCDEPFSGLDPTTVRLVESLLVRLTHEISVTMIIASHHIPSTLRMADHIVLLVDGEAIQGTPAEIQASDDPRVQAFLIEEREARGEAAP